MTPHSQTKHLLPSISRSRRAAVAFVFLELVLALAGEKNMPSRLPLMEAASTEALRIETPRAQGPSLTNGRSMPELDGAIGWLNSTPLGPKSLRGKVVLVDFWTYTCINSLRPLPYLKSWAEKYKEAGLVVIGVHTPEFSFERERKNVEDAVHRLNVRFPVAIDSDYSLWRGFSK